MGVIISLKKAKQLQKTIWYILLIEMMVKEYHIQQTIIMYVKEVVQIQMRIQQPQLQLKQIQQLYPKQKQLQQPQLVLLLVLKTVKVNANKPVMINVKK